MLKSSFVSLLLLSVAFNTSAHAATVNTSRSNIKHIAVHIEGTTFDAASVAGGEVTPVVIVDGNEAPFVYSSGRGRTTYSPITLEAGGLSPVMYQWIQASLDGKEIRKSGSVVVFDDQDLELYRLDFEAALLTRLGIPACDGASKDTSYLVIQIAPEVVKATTTGRLMVGRYANDRVVQKKWLPANFRLKIGGIDDAALTGVTRIEAVDHKQKAIENTVGEPRAYDRKSATVADLPHFSISGALDSALFNGDLLANLAGKDASRTLTVTYLTHDGTALFDMIYPDWSVLGIGSRVDSSGAQVSVAGVSTRGSMVPHVDMRMHKGTVKFFNEAKGFGFIVEDGTDTPLYFDTEGLATDKVKQGSPVIFMIQEGKKGLNAVNVKLA